MPKYFIFEIYSENAKNSILSTRVKPNPMCKFSSNIVFSLIFSRRITPHKNDWKNSIIWVCPSTLFLKFTAKTQKIPFCPREVKPNPMCKFSSNIVFSLIFSRRITPHKNDWKNSIIWVCPSTLFLKYTAKTQKFPFCPRG